MDTVSIKGVIKSPIKIQTAIIKEQPQVLLEREESLEEKEDTSTGCMKCFQNPCQRLMQDILKAFILMEKTDV